MVIETICLSCTGTGRDGHWYRVKRGQWHIADVRMVEQLVGLGIDLADLRETCAHRGQRS